MLGRNLGQPGRPMLAFAQRLRGCSQAPTPTSNFRSLTWASLTFLQLSQPKLGFHRAGIGDKPCWFTVCWFYLNQDEALPPPPWWCLCYCHLPASCQGKDFSAVFCWCQPTPVADRQKNTVVISMVLLERPRGKWRKGSHQSCQRNPFSTPQQILGALI